MKKMTKEIICPICGNKFLKPITDATDILEAFKFNFWLYIFIEHLENHKK